MMKWWGWGDPNKSFPIEDKPNLWPWIKKTISISENKKIAEPVKREDIKLSPVNISEDFLSEIKQILKNDQISTTEDDRLLHSYGKSYADLFYVRKGIVKKSPDIILYPLSHDEVENIIKIANTHNVCVIPFGGGTNIVGGVDPRDQTVTEKGPRCIVTLDMCLMNKLISIDPQSQTAVIQAGVLGPKLEKDLSEKGWALGHFPDSFEYSTLGGWLATRSAGMQSDAYGKIEDMLVSLKMVTPSGTIITRTTPASSAGPDINRLIVGSEGILGVITEATMRIHRTPAAKDYRGYLFPNFEKGVEAIRECVDKNWIPSMIRFQDEGETQLAFNLKSPKKGIESIVQKQLKKILSVTGYARPCIMVVGFEGDDKQVQIIANEATKILKKHRAFSLGKGIGKTWSKDKFNIPYLRDYIMDYGVMTDVAETAAVWSKLINVHKKTIEEMNKYFKSHGDGTGYIGCHISHTYKTGACLYFTYAAKQIIGKEIEQYYGYKKIITDTFMKNGATLTHHHAVGYEHSPWMESEISSTGLKALKGIKNTLDPKNILNPGKVFPVEEEMRLGVFGIDAPEIVNQSKSRAKKRSGQTGRNLHEDTIR
ncbi:FAD-binding oxidoreductase [Fluviispira multicolorata]|nr:FAD-binding oxidoreductase [Fluviispira multicolorata]